MSSSIPDRSRVKLPEPTLYEFAHALCLREPDISYEMMRTMCTGYIAIRDSHGPDDFAAKQAAINAEIDKVQERIQAELGGYFAHADALAAFEKACARIAPKHRAMTDDGLAAALRDIGAVLRWNLTARRVEVRWIDLPDGWHVVTGAVLDTLMNAVSKVATMNTRGSHTAPWAPTNAGMERRLLTAVAMRRQEKGPGTHVYVATLAWDASLGRAGKCLSITTIVKEIDALHHWENALRTSADVYADVSTGLIDTGMWAYHDEYESCNRKHLCVWVRTGDQQGAKLNPSHARAAARAREQSTILEDSRCAT